MRDASEFDVPFLAWYDSEARYWKGIDENDRVMTTVEMLSALMQGYKAYVVNHRGYIAYVSLDENNEPYWLFPLKKYVSEFYDDGEHDKLRWIIR